MGSMIQKKIMELKNGKMTLNIKVNFLKEKSMELALIYGMMALNMKEIVIKNIMEGYGIKYYNKRKVYIGEWKNNLKDGFGEFLFVGRKYIGFFSKEQIEGFGIYYWAKTNIVYVGFFKNGKQLDFGKFIIRNNRKYGNWITHTQVNWFKTKEEAFLFYGK